MPLRDLFSFRDHEGQQFSGWPPAPSIRPVPIKAEGLLQANLEAGDENKEIQEEQYPPTLIVAIGKTGEQTLSLLAEKISQGTTGGNDRIHALVVTDSSSAVSAYIGRQIRTLELPQSINLRDRPISPRLVASHLFREAITYKRYQDWLHETLLDLGGDVQVFFVGSLAEPAIGLLGDALQILAGFSNSMGKTSLFSRVSVFLSLCATSSVIMPAEEIFASCREIGRFTFNGPHIMPAFFGQTAVIKSAMLDYLFVLDDFLLPNPDGKNGETISRLLADSLFSLIHPSARPLWENLRNDLSLSGQIRQRTRQGVIHSIGNAALYIPLNAVKRYTATRLARAVMFGEQTNVAEGLLQSSTTISRETPRSLARRFLLDGPFPHPIYDWLLNVNGPAAFHRVPDSTPEFLQAFQAQLSHSLTKYLNQFPVDLELACNALNWLDEHLANCENWFQASKPPNPNMPERFMFQHILFEWRETLQYLAKDLANWQKSFFSDSRSESPSYESGPSSDWRRAKEITWRSQRKKDGEGPSVAASLFDILKRWQSEAEMSLASASGDSVYRSALADESNGMAELETYYADTVRPELSRLGAPAGNVFMNICRRLEWWIHLAPDLLPQIYLVCWPAAAVPSTEPPPETRFRSDQIHPLASSLVDLAFSQTETLEADLTTVWFSRRIKRLAGFLRRAEDVHLKYDHNLAAQISHAASRRSYLIAHSPTLSREVVDIVFPNTLRREINELADGPKSRFTAITLRLNIPVDAIAKFQDFRQDYLNKASDSIHIYSQERTAANYEKRFWKINRERILLVPEITILLADPQLTTLYFQALFTGTLRVEINDLNNESCWTMSAVGDFPPLKLAVADKDGMLLALRKFALELPNASDINHNPRNHFYSSNRPNYLSALTKRVKELAFKPEARAVRDSLKYEFNEWRSRGEQDELARSFHALIVCELDEPVWSKW